jgi:hypothetical protein
MKISTLTGLNSLRKVNSFFRNLSKVKGKLFPPFLLLGLVFSGVFLNAHAQTLETIGFSTLPNTNGGVSKHGASSSNPTLTVTTTNTGERFNNYSFSVYGSGRTDAVAAQMNGDMNINFCTPVYGLDLVIDDIDLQKKTRIEFFDASGKNIPYTTYFPYIKHTGSNVNVYAENTNRLAADSKSNTDLKDGKLTQIRFVFPDNMPVKNIWFKNNWTDLNNRAGLGIVRAKVQKPTLKVESICQNNKQVDTYTSYFQTIPGEQITFDWYTRGIVVHTVAVIANSSGLAIATYTPLETSFDHYQTKVSRSNDGECNISSSNLERVGNALSPVISGLKPANQSVCVGEAPAKLEVNGITGVTYQWYSNTTNSNVGGTAIDRATLPSYTPPTTTAGTVYYYVGLSRGGCTTYSTPLVVTTDAACLDITLVKKGELSSDQKTIKYSFEVTNQGDVPLTDVKVNDPKLNPTNIVLSKTTLGLREKATGSATYTITQQDITTGKISNSATVTAKNDKGATVTDKSGVTESSDEPTVITLKGCIPYFNPIIKVSPNTKVEGSQELLFELDIKKVTECASASPTKVIVNKNQYFSFNWENYKNAVSIAGTNVSGLENAKWTFSETEAAYIWTYNSIDFPTSGLSKIGFKGTWNAGATSGKANFGITIFNEAGGETRATSNFDTTALDWFRMP